MTCDLDKDFVHNVQKENAYFRVRKIALPPWRMDETREKQFRSDLEQEVGKQLVSFEPIDKFSQKLLLIRHELRSLISMGNVSAADVGRADMRNYEERYTATPRPTPELKTLFTPYGPPAAREELNPPKDAYENIQTGPRHLR